MKEKEPNVFRRLSPLYFLLILVILKNILDSSGSIWIKLTFFFRGLFS